MPWTNRFDYHIGRRRVGERFIVEFFVESRYNRYPREPKKRLKIKPDKRAVAKKEIFFVV